MNGTSPCIAMLKLRATPLDDSTPSPDKLQGNQRYRTALLAVMRASYNNEVARQSVLNRQEYAGHDTYDKELPALLPQNTVWLQKAPNTSLSQPATVKSTHYESTPRAYVVSTPDGIKYQQNRVMLWQRVITDEKLSLPPKATSVNIGAPIQVCSPQLSKCDSP